MFYCRIKEDSSKFLCVPGRGLLTRKYRIRILLYRKDRYGKISCMYHRRSPSNVIKRDDGWKAFCIQGILDFSLIGILSKIAAILADNDISIFAASTYNTNYVFVKSQNYQRGLEILKSAGYGIITKEKEDYYSA